MENGAAPGMGSGSPSGGKPGSALDNELDAVAGNSGGKFVEEQVPG